MIDRTEQERVLSFIVQKYNKTKGSNTERHNAHPMSRMMCLKQHRVTAHSPPSPHRTENYGGKRY